MINKPIIAVIQSRMESSRLPGKAMMEICGKPIIEHVIERTKKIKGIHTIILATSTDEKNQPIINLAKKHKCDTFSGPENDVLERYYQITKLYNNSYILKVTGDSPLIDPDLASNIITKVTNDYDYINMSGVPLGVEVELIKNEALIKIHRESTGRYNKEHISNYIKTNPNKFKIKTYDMNLKVKDGEKIKLTISTKEDFDFVENIYKNLYKNKIFTTKEVLDFINNS